MNMEKPCLVRFSIKATSIVIMTLFEYLTSVVCELIWGQILWDYSDKFMNFQGRICLSSSIAWGALSVLAVKVLGPAFHKVYDRIEGKEIVHIMIPLAIGYIIICYIIRPVFFPDMV